MKTLIVIVLSVWLSACSMQTPPYQASLVNVQAIKNTDIKEVSVGSFAVAKSLNSISIRGSSMSSSVDKSYGAYLAKALEEELKLAKVWSAVSSNVISGEILTNDIDSSSFSKGLSEISSKFTVTRDGNVLFEKTLSATHQFESSFMGAIAIPNAQASYVPLIQELLKKLFKDEDFISALKS